MVPEDNSCVKQCEGAMKMMRLAVVAAVLCVVSTAASAADYQYLNGKIELRIGERICWPGWPRISPIPRTSQSVLRPTAMFTPMPFSANSPAFIRSSGFIIPPIAPTRRSGASWMAARDGLSALKIPETPDGAGGKPAKPASPRRPAGGAAIRRGRAARRGPR